MTLMENALVFGVPAGAGDIYGRSLGLFVHYLHFGCKSQCLRGMKFHTRGEEFGSLLGVQSVGQLGRLEL